MGGIPIDCLLLFFSGGWSAGDITPTETISGVDRITVRFTAGGGLTYAITDNLIDKIEYRYYDLGTYHRTAQPTARAAVYRYRDLLDGAARPRFQVRRQQQSRGERLTYVECAKHRPADRNLREKSGMIACSVQVVLVALATTIAVAVAVRPAEAADKHLKHKAHSSVHGRSTQGRAAPRGIGPMRYYGGPKSPMWREVN
ncbi:MAG: hypothetical protein JO283_16320 [Bradyrhizobium sp.]|nr:hypothetical protein [Bradyrhizobium sp.]